MIIEGDWMAARRPNLQDMISDDLNIGVWSEMMKSSLTEKGVWDVVANGIPPDPLKNPKLAATIRPEGLCNWRELVRKDLKALQILQSSLTDSVFRKTLSVTSAKELWDLLNEVPYHEADRFGGDFRFNEKIWMISDTNSNHLTRHEKFFTTLDRSRRHQVNFTDGYTIMAEGIGDVTFMTKDGRKTIIKNVLYVPMVVANALSVAQLKRNGFDVRMDTERCTMSIWDETANKYFGEPMWEDIGFCLSLDVIGGNIQSKKRKTR